MNRPTQNRYLPALMLGDRAIARSLLIGSFMTSLALVLPSYAASVEPLPPGQPALQPTAKPETPVTPVPVAKQLLGQWLAKEVIDGDLIMLIFAPDGNVFILSGTSASGNAIGKQFQYRIDDRPRPMHLDVTLTTGATVKSVFEFTADGDLRLQVEGTRPNLPRPAALTDTATLFQKLSDDTTLPPGAEVDKLRLQQNKSLNEFRFGHR